ncbi:hypothetical protein [Rhodococcus sp. IEGM 1307]|uniref:hypothetical protein n=1 Tax=Rhodococcus sp. IEGM 1307 TaxID=3047091 RepID=UPI0024B85EFD|nr:hypothetical protein [Rhodococcus sp. IEGM 1307]MDI9979431.1 hypothetical protein [Rhodococcus sp. IEGM 1307]
MTTASSRDGQQPALSKPPGLLVLSMTVLPLVGLLGMRYDKPRALSGMTIADELLVGTLLTLALAVSGLVWMIRTLHVVGQDQRWSWWIVVSPIAVALALLVYVVVPA